MDEKKVSSNNVKSTFISGGLFNNEGYAFADGYLLTSDGYYTSKDNGTFVRKRNLKD